MDLMERGDFTNRRGVLDDGSAGRVLLQGERTSASVAKGQVNTRWAILVVSYRIPTLFIVCLTRFVFFVLLIFTLIN